jgi:DNA-binding MarR family transcriptional regulator
MPKNLQRLIKQAKPFRSLEAELFLNVLRTSTMLLGEMTEVLRSYELTQPQYNVLRILRGAGDEGLPLGEIGERMVNREPDISRLIDRMEARALVERQRSATDRRMVSVRLTSDGRRVVDSLDAPIAEMHMAQLAHMSREELKQANALLERMRERPESS